MSGRINNQNFHTFPAKAAVIIDGGYLRQVLYSYNITKLDFVALTDAVCKPAYRIRTYYYDGKTQETQSFHDYVQYLDRFEVVLGEVVQKTVICPECNKNFPMQTQKRVDVALAVQLVHLATSKQVDSIILIAGDRDFIPAIETAKHAGAIIKLVHGPMNTVSNSLLKLVDEKVHFDPEFLNKYKISWKSKQVPKPKEKKVVSKQKEKADEVISTIEEIIKEFIMTTTEDYHHLSRIGIELTNKITYWKEITGKKKLINIVTEYPDLFIIKKDGISYQITLRNFKHERKTKSDDVESFLLTIIADHSKNKNKPLSMAELGNIMREKNPQWKKNYKITSLKKAIATISDQISIQKTKQGDIITLN